MVNRPVIFRPAATRNSVLNTIWIKSLPAGLLFIVVLLLAATFSLGGPSNSIDAPRMMKRIKKAISLKEDQTAFLEPLVQKFCSSLNELRNQSAQQKPPGDIEGVRVEVQKATRELQNAAAAHLSQEQQAAMGKFLEAWNEEFLHDIFGIQSKASVTAPPAGGRVSLSAAPAGFEDSLGSSVTELSNMRSNPSDAAAPSAEKQKRGEVAIAPFPLVNPTIGNGVVLVAAYYRRVNMNDKISPPSVFGIGGIYTDSHSWAAGYGNKLYLKKDRFRILGALGLAQLNYDFYGIGNDAGENGFKIPIHQKGFGFVAGGQVRTYKRWHLGAKYRFMTAKTSVDLNEIFPGLPVDIQPFTLNINNAGLTPMIERDSRDSQTYSRKGSRFDVQATFNGKDLGGDYGYQQYNATFDQFFSLGKHQVLAYTVSGCATEGDIPFFDMCMLGKSSNLRGYAMGKYQDRRMLVGQAEYRLELVWRLGIVGFLGAGEVGDKWSSFNWGNVLPGGGFGLRFLLAKHNHVNLRADFAWGKDSYAWYMGLGEAF